MKYNSYFFKIFRIVFVNIFLSTCFFIIYSFDIPGIMVEIVAREFNNDLNLDLAVANNGDNDVSILLGNGDAFFPFRNDFEVGDAPSSIAVGLFNADSNFDLAVANSDDHTVSILLGNGDGTFTHAAKVEVDTAPSSIAVGDFNNDSNSDLAVAAFFNTGVVSIRLGNGDGLY